MCLLALVAVFHELSKDLPSELSYKAVLIVRRWLVVPEILSAFISFETPGSGKI